MKYTADVSPRESERTVDNERAIGNVKDLSTTCNLKGELSKSCQEQTIEQTAQDKVEWVEFTSHEVTLSPEAIAQRRMWRALHFALHISKLSKDLFLIPVCSILELMETGHLSAFLQNYDCMLQCRFHAGSDALCVWNHSAHRKHSLTKMSTAV